MSLSAKDRFILKSEGFLNYEINQLHKATVNQYSSASQDIDIASTEFKRLRASRKRQVKGLRKKGLNQQQIGSFLFNYYRGKPDRSIMDLLQFDYYKTRRNVTRQDFDKKKRHIHQKFGKNYSKPYG